jgi:8-hydroxy-5-deazaflavin:NADPH oxidoreductase
MKVGIIGSGIVGQMLGIGFLNEGHEVMLGTRHLLKEEVTKWQAENPSGKTGSFDESAAFGDVLVLAVPGSAVTEAITLAGKEKFKNKVVIDATNPIASAPPVNGVLKFFTDLDESLMEKTQKEIPDAKLVKAFNSVGNSFFYKPDLAGMPPSMFICGNDEDAKRTVSKILESFGWEVEDMGKIEAARAIEPLCILWCIPGLLRNEWQHAFKLLKMMK